MPGHYSSKRVLKARISTDQELTPSITIQNPPNGTQNIQSHLIHTCLYTLLNVQETNDPCPTGVYIVIEPKILSTCHQCNFYHYVLWDLNWSLLLLLPYHQIPTYTFTPTTSKASCNPGYWWSYCYGRCFHGKWPFSNFKHLINSIQCFHLRKMTLFSLLLITTCLEVRMRHLCIK